MGGWAVEWAVLNPQKVTRWYRVLMQFYKEKETAEAISFSHNSRIESGTECRFIVSILHPYVKSKKRNYRIVKYDNSHMINPHSHLVKGFL